MKKCISKNLFEENKKLKEELEKIKLELLKKDELISFQKSLFENCNNASKQVNNQTNTNNITIFNTSGQSLKDIISNLEPINFDEIKQDFESKFSNKYIDKGIAGLAQFLCDFPCNNKFVTTDYARKMIIQI